jgi:hypothetical protein
MAKGSKVIRIVGSYPDEVQEGDSLAPSYKRIPARFTSVKAVLIFVSDGNCPFYLCFQITETKQ